MAPHNHRMLCEAIAAAGVELGAYDHRIVQWLARWEPETCAVIAGLIADEYVWAAEHGHQAGDDPDVIDLKPDPWTYLAALGERCVTGKGTHKRLDLAAAREYSALKVRLEVGGTFHVHPPDSPGPVHDGPVPEHCGWPGRLRPSGWQCRAALDGRG